jgi:MGT family glycosyltransferase
LCAEWRPDVLVIEEADFGSVVAAERLGLPYANLLVTAAGSFVRAEVVGETLNELRAAHDLPPDPELTMLRRYLVLSPFPPSFRDPAYPLPTTAFSFRPPICKEAAKVDWSPALPDAPTIYFTLGTIFNMESGDLFTRVLDGLRDLRLRDLRLHDLPINVVITVGNEIDPEEFGPQPPNISIRRYIAQEAILPRCKMVISHGGSGSVTGALLHGLPMVLIPMGADQPLNAARCVQLGVGRMLDPIAATPDSVGEAVSDVLADPSYHLAAERIRAEFEALPGPEKAVTLLEQLAVEKRPIALA